MSERKASQADLLVELALATDAELFRDPEGVAYATIGIDHHRETWRLASTPMRRWLQRRFWEAFEKAPGSQAVQDAFGVLEGKALFEGEEHPVHVRLAEHQGVVYLDLVDPAWRAVEVSTSGWRLVEDPPVRFRRARGMLALPEPERGGSLEELRAFLNTATDDDFVLICAWLVAGLRPAGPYVVLVLHGEQDSAKSTTARVARKLLDPSSAEVRSAPREDRDLAIAANNGWVLALDNLSHLSDWRSDALCRLATGGGFSTRELYTDAEEVIFDAQRPVILNGIEDLATRGDLLDRSIVLYLPAIPEHRRMAEQDFWRQFDAARPRLLGALLEAVSAALAGLDAVEVEALPRMADFAKWTVAASPALGWEPGRFMAAYTGNRAAANEISLEATPIVQPLREVAQNGGFDGTATELLERLERLVGTF